MQETLTVEFHRHPGPGHRELRGTFTDVDLSPEDQRAWLDTERPHASRRSPGSGHWATYELTFKRGGERRRVVLSETDLDARLLPLITRLTQLCEAH